MSLGKSSIYARYSTVEKYIRFCLQYYCHTCIVYLNSVGLNHETQSTQSKNNNFFYDYSTTMVHGSHKRVIENIQSDSTLMEKKFQLQYYYGKMNLEKTLSTLDLTEKNSF